MVNKLRWVERPARCGECEFYKRQKFGNGVCDLPFMQSVCTPDTIRHDCPLPAWDFSKEVCANARQKQADGGAD